MNPQLLPPSPGWARSLPNGPDHRVKITEAYAKLVARDAYFWAWPLVNIFNPRQAFKDVTEIVLAGAAPMAPPNNFGMGAASAYILALMIGAIALVYMRFVYKRVTL